MKTCPYCGIDIYSRIALDNHLTNVHNLKIVPKEITQMKKFYVGADAPHTNGWGKDTVEEAIAHGKKLMADNPSKDKVYIVQVIKVIKRPKPEMIVVDVE